MSARRKVRVAFFDFACCEGCQAELTNLSDPIFVGLLDHVEFVEFREVMKERTTEPIDIAFVEGSFTREADRARLEDIRRRASIVIAYGACAATAGINAMKNHTDAYKEFNKLRGSQGYVAAIVHARDPTIPLVLMEDTAAMIGLLVALIAVGLAALTGNHVFDSIGSIVIAGERK